MNDRYLFKAKRIDNGGWVIGNLAHLRDIGEKFKTIIIPVKNIYRIAESEYPTYTFGNPCKSNYELNIEHWHEVDSSTICQCTGLKDKNGNLIWENDTVKIADISSYLTIERDDETASYLIADRIGIQFKLVPFWDNVKDELEVVGNAFDNPKLHEVERR